MKGTYGQRAIKLPIPQGRATFITWVIACHVCDHTLIVQVAVAERVLRAILLSCGQWNSTSRNWICLCLSLRPQVPKILTFISDVRCTVIIS